MDEGEIEIRPIIRKQRNVVFKSTANLAYRAFLNIKQARLFIQYVISGLCRDIFEKAILPYMVREKRSAFRPRELVEWVNRNRKGDKDKLFGHSKITNYDKK